MKLSSKIMLVGLLALPGFGWMAWTSYDAPRRIERSAIITARSLNFVKTMNQAAQAVRKVESGMQEFIRSGDPNAAAYTTRLNSLIARQLETATVLAADNSHQQTDLSGVMALAHRNANRQQAVIRAFRPPQAKGLFTQAKQELRMGVDSITRLIADITQQEQLSALTRLENQGPVKSASMFSMFAGSMLVFALVSFMVYVFNRKPAHARARLNGAGPLTDEDPSAVMLTTDLSGHFTIIGSQITLLTGYDPKELLNKDICFLTTPAFTNLVADHFKRQHLAKRPESKIYFPIFTKTGEHKWVEQLSVLKHVDGKIVGFECILKAISSDGDETEEPKTGSEKRQRYIASQTSGPDQKGLSKGSWNLPDF